MGVLDEAEEQRENSAGRMSRVMLLENSIRKCKQTKRVVLPNDWFLHRLNGYLLNWELTLSN